MRENRLRTLWKNDQAAVNGWLAIPNSFSAEVMAHQGWDSLTIDLQHGVIDYAAMVTMLQAISTTATVPVVRVPWLEPGIIMKSLDAGAYGVICPMVSTREEAQRFIAYTNYAPRGTRSFGPVRATLYGGADYPTQANDTIVRFAMIETAQALDNLDAILSVEGLDAIYIGPSDLSLALGCKPVFDDVDPKAAQAIDHIIERAKAHGVVAGIHNGRPDVARSRIDLGFRCVLVSGTTATSTASTSKLSVARPCRTVWACASGSFPWRRLAHKGLARRSFWPQTERRAVRGPISYDVASLLRDAFISWDEAQEIDWAVRYWEAARRASLPVPDVVGHATCGRSGPGGARPSPIGALTYASRSSG